MPRPPINIIHLKHVGWKKREVWESPLPVVTEMQFVVANIYNNIAQKEEE